MAPRLTGWKKDPHSIQDHHAHLLLGAAPPPPPSASLRDRVGGPSGVLDQVRSDCVANSTAKAIQVALSLRDVIAPLPSRNWIYYMAGALEGAQHEDNGRYLRDAFDALSTVGWPSETAWPYDDRWNRHPGAEVHRLAYDYHKAFSLARYRISSTGEQRVTEIKQAIASGYPVVVGGQITQAWEEQSGQAPLPLEFAASVGGHAYTLLEYDPDGVHPLNSWGPAWGAYGWGWLSWAWADTFEDIWVVALSPRRAGES